MCVIASKNKDVLSRIFGTLESLNQHNLNKFFVERWVIFSWQLLSSLCFLFMEVECFTFQSEVSNLSQFWKCLWWHFSPSWHCISCKGLTDPFSLSGESFKSSDVRGGRKHTGFTFDFKNTLFNGAFPVKEKILSETNGIVLFQEHMKWGWAVQSPDSFGMFWPRYTFSKNNPVCCSR